MGGGGGSDPALLLRYVTPKTSSFRVTGWVGGGVKNLRFWRYVICGRSLRILKNARHNYIVFFGKLFIVVSSAKDRQ